MGKSLAEDNDKESKTEQPSEKKISDALEKGNVPFSREVPTLVSFIAMLMGLTFFVYDGGIQLTGSLTRYIDQSEQIALENFQDVNMLLSSAGIDMFMFLVPLLLVSFVLGLAASLVQNPPRIVFDRVKFDPKRISLKSGWKRLFGKQGQVEFLKALFKFSAVAFVAAIILSWSKYDIFNGMLVHPSGLPALTLELGVRILAGLAIASVFLAGADWAWSRWFWRSELMMTKQEVKDEHKQLEGDPIVKAKRHSLRQSKARQNMLNSVPMATVVITNPTHFSVALRYDAETDPAPVVVAKGQDYLAQKIRTIAKENEVPLVENKTLARALYASVSVGSVIPSEFYKAVAEIILFLSSSKLVSAAPTRKS